MDRWKMGLLHSLRGLCGNDAARSGFPPGRPRRERRHRGFFQFLWDRSEREAGDPVRGLGAWGILGYVRYAHWPAILGIEPIAIALRASFARSRADPHQGTDVLCHSESSCALVR